MTAFKRLEEFCSILAPITQKILDLITRRKEGRERERDRDFMSFLVGLSTNLIINKRLTVSGHDDDEKCVQHSIRIMRSSKYGSWEIVS